MSKLIIAFGLLGLISTCVGQGVEQVGQCDYTVKAVQEFDLNAYLGVWYDIESLPSSFQTGTCNTATYTLNAAGTAVNVQNTHIINGIMDIANGIATPQKDADGSGKLDVVFDTTGIAAPYWVLDTDYNTFALVYSCRNTTSITRTINSWKLGRNKGPLPLEARNRIDAVIRNVSALSTVSYEVRDHSEEACSYLVEFEGTCPTTVTGVTDFAVQRFLGTWYEFARYPQTAQTGQCNRAVYGPEATTLGVYPVENSQVTNETRLTISGQVQGTTESGVLEVTLNIAGEQRVQYLYVLATDYENYALLYSCTVIGNRRRIGSWQLRKALEPLSEETTIAMNNAFNTAISNTPDLNVAYYRPTSQTAASCFYYPDFPENPEFIELPGLCDNSVTGVDNFDVQRFLGTWYELYRYPQPTQTGQCNRAVYGPEATAPGVYPVKNSQVTNETLLTVSGEVTGTNQSGVLAVTLIVGGERRTQNLYVLATDYNNFAFVYTCTDDTERNQRRVGSWILSKFPYPLSDNNINIINGVISNTQGLRRDLYQPTSQTAASCFYFPDFPENPEFIELPGYCDNTNMAGVAGFNMESFLGTWYEVARYPQPTQTGQCNRAVYGKGPTTGVYTVQNSQVREETLFTISGEARPTGQVGTGVLHVTFIVNGERRHQTLYVLATDHDSYALLYSCTNDFDREIRRVGSWKLSKSLGPLSDEANNDINAAISNTRDLREDLYQPTSQNATSCFYYPEFPENPTEILLPGVCDESITGVANFDAEKFLGTWYELYRYPQPTQTGQCNRAVYGPEATAPGVYPVKNSQVTNETLLTVSGEVTGTNQSGVLTVTLIVGGERRTQNLHILATNYNTFALVYTCTDDIERNQRRVGSWILARFPYPLSDNNINAINDAINNTQGLRRDLYQPTSQTAASCFYFPDFPENPEFIELPGYCDTNIAGVAGFNVESFLGTWYEVARYPQPTQTGQCNRAVYGKGPTTGVYTVQNSQVREETLFTISGEARPTGQVGTGVLHVTFTVNGERRHQTLYVLATDHDSYALLYSCTNDFDREIRRVGSWKLSKSLDPLSDEANNNINAVISNTRDLREDLYQPTSQNATSCFYYPEFPENPTEILLPGVCDESITGVANFDAEKYLGAWYEVARYPQPTQTGQCNRAVYGPGTTTGVYTVQNSQVINEALSTISGEARPTTQSGVLAVTFTVNGEERNQNLYVLATDYDNYALAYSCTNLPENTRRVGSWKLSRSLEPLSTAANNAINAVISNTQGLREDIYRVTQQTEVACWYYPQQTGDNVVIPGQCDTAIPGVPNINVARLANGSVWYHIRRYDAVGERSCIGTRLTLDGDYINVHSIEVIGGEANRTEGVARLNSAATGKFDLEMSNSDKVEIYVLATDYNNYAIAYSCENEGTTHRKIGVWLLSRTRTWPTVGNVPLNILVNTRREIHLDYFKDIPHTGEKECPEPSSAFLFRSSIIVIFVCTVLQLVW